MGKRETVFNMLGGKCFYCGCELDFDNFHMDHFKAKSNHGKVKDNLVPACVDCNLFKSNLDIEDFRNRIVQLPTEKFHARMVCKYFDVKAKPVKFYYEEMNYGTL